MENEMKKKSPVISIIVPVYKVEPYLRCCIDSILAQTFQDFELILVDDGSPDNCGAICDEYAAKDDRIVVIHQENGGVSAARNAGLDWVFANSDSEWIIFVDSDDAIVTTCLEHLYMNATQTNADIAVALASGFWKDHELESMFDGVISIDVVNGREACARQYQGDAVVVWGKLIRKHIAENLRFPVGKIHEDQEYAPKIYFLAHSVVLLRAWLYCYRHREGSITHQMFSIRRFDNIDAYDSCIQFYQKHQDAMLVKLAEKQKNNTLAQYNIQAWRWHLQNQIPEKYKMNLGKASLIALRYNLKRVGWRGCLEKVCALFR